MTRYRRTSQRLLVAGMWLFTLAAILGFAAEPSTSTQYDAGEGRGVLVVQHAAHTAPGVTATAVRLSGRALGRLAFVLTGLLLLAPLRRRRARADGTWTRDALRWATLARRGPPAPALG